MTKEQAVEVSARAIAKLFGPEEGWDRQPVNLDTARKIVAALEALGLLKLSN
jgi:hypothetical protein